MTPVYFPFTWMPETVAGLLERLFGRVVLYQPLCDTPECVEKKPSLGSIITRRVPFATDSDGLRRAWMEFQAWGRRQGKEGASLKAMFQDGFHQPATAAQLRSDILHQNRPQPDAPDRLFSARLFLLMAQELDARQYEVDRELLLVNRSERDLFAQMRGDAIVGAAPDMAEYSGDYGAVMADARLSAWARLFVADDPGPCCWVTTSPAVMARMGEVFPEMVRIGGWKGGASVKGDGAREAFLGILEILARNPLPATPASALEVLEQGAQTPAALTVYCLPKTGLKRAAAVLLGDIAPTGSGQEEENGVVVLVGSGKAILENF